MVYASIMNLYLSHISALEFWRSLPPKAARPPYARVKAIPASHTKFDLGLIDTLPTACSHPVHILVPDKQSRIQTQKIVSHVLQGPLPAKSLVRLSDSVYASSPELCFVQLAGSVCLVKLIRLGFELCGSYALSRVDGRGFEVRSPLTDVSSLEEYLSAAKGMYGISKAKQAHRYVVAGSASPMETIVVLLLCLPLSLGGYGFPVPVLNYRINVGKSASRLAEKSYYACDVCWPEAMVAVEYDSTMWHTGASRITHDSKRRNALISMGIEVMTLTAGQVFEYFAFDWFAHQLAKRMGYRLRVGPHDCDVRRKNLRALLFDIMENGI